MLNQDNFKNEICTKWECLSKIDHNYYDSIEDSSKNIDFESFKKSIVHKLENKSVVVNAGHFIPNSDEYEDIGENALKTWELGCQLVNYLKKKSFRVKISLILNDIDLTIPSRKKLFENNIYMPKKYHSIMNDYGLDENDILHCHWNKAIIFTEKKLSNRIEHLIRRKKIKQEFEQAENYCISALTMYFIDIVGNNIDTSIFIMPKCSWNSIFSSIKLFNRLNGSTLKHIAFFETKNCIN